MDSGLLQLYASIPLPSGQGRQEAVYAVRPIPGSEGHLLGRSLTDHPALLLNATGEWRAAPPVALENITAAFSVRCMVQHAGEEAARQLTVVECLSPDNAIQAYFLRISEKLLDALGACPSHSQITEAISTLVSLFEKLSRPSSQGARGIFGELLLIERSRSPSIAISAWHGDPEDRYDFVTDEARLEVKTSATRGRIHEFSFEQCSSPAGTVAVVASIFLEQAGGGTSLGELVERVEAKIGSSMEQLVKLHAILAETLGSDLQAGLRARFDEHLAVASMAFFDLAAIPALRGDLPPGVTAVRFRSDLSGLKPTPVARLSARSTALRALLPLPHASRSAPNFRAAQLSARKASSLT